MGVKVARVTHRKPIMPHRRLSLVDLFVILGLFLLIGAFSFATAGAMSETKNRIACASNLRQIGQALLLYAKENRGAYPRTLRDQKVDDPKPVWGTPYELHKDLGAGEAD